MDGLESKLDAVGFSYLDQVPIKMNSVYSLTVNLDEINALLNQELPKCPVDCSYDWEKGKVGLKHLLSELESREAAQEEEIEKLKSEVENKQRILAAEAEEQQKELENQLSNLKCSSPSEETEPNNAQTSESIETQNNLISATSITHPPINYSDFEAASDPFESAELQTINDLQELAACFPSVPPQTHSSQFYFPPVTTSAVSTHHSIHHPSNAPHTSAFNQELKSSKSFGDILGEIKKEDENIPLNQYIKPVKSVGPSLTPPASISKAKGLENWTPWPNLDTLENEKDPFEGLSEQERSICLSLSEMGFSKSRLSKGARSLSADSEKIINFCLIVDELKSKNKCSEEEIEDIVLMNDSDEEESRKYLSTFIHIKELGFPSSDIHMAMKKGNNSKDEALKVLLRD